VADVFALCMVSGIIIGAILLCWFPYTAFLISTGAFGSLALIIIWIWNADHTLTETLLRKEKKIQSLRDELADLEKEIPQEKKDYVSENLDSLKKIHKLETKIQKLEVQIEILSLGVNSPKES
jgi:peptidoglycan hydrolase CwlO-like protein